MAGVGGNRGWHKFQCNQMDGGQNFSASLQRGVWQNLSVHIDEGHPEATKIYIKNVCHRWRKICIYDLIYITP